MASLGGMGCTWRHTQGYAWEQDLSVGRVIGAHRTDRDTGRPYGAGGRALEPSVGCGTGLRSLGHKDTLQACRWGALWGSWALGCPGRLLPGMSQVAAGHHSLESLT